MEKAKQLVKVNKVKARNAYNKGLEVYVLPCKIRMDNQWVQPVKIQNKCGETFDAVVNAYEVYNCNNEVGKYAHYYIYE